MEELHITLCWHVISIAHQHLLKPHVFSRHKKHHQNGTVPFSVPKDSTVLHLTRDITVRVSKSILHY